MENPVIIIGANSLGKTALDIFSQNGVVVYGFLDEDSSKHNTEINVVPVLGHPEDGGFLKLIGKKCEAFIASDDNKFKSIYAETIQERKVMPVNCIHNSAAISDHAAIGHGNMIQAFSVLSPDIKMGHFCNIGSHTVIEPDVQIADYVQIGNHVSIGAGVVIEEGAFIGSGAVIVSGVTVGKHARIGAGSIVVRSIQKAETVFGNPAEKIK